MAEIKNLVPDHLATFIVHWPAGPTPMCAHHAGIAVNIGSVMGHHIACTPAGIGEECENCKDGLEEE